MMAEFVEGIFLAPEGGSQMKGVQAATALEGCGLEGDRYCAGTGHWKKPTTARSGPMATGP